jgi:Zn-dependent M28 family amino/carboxypeptidase
MKRRASYGSLLHQLLCFTCAAWVLLHPRASAGEVESGRLINTVNRLQAMGNRTTWEKQWEAASWIAAEFERYGIPARIESYDHRQRKWPNVVASIPGSEDDAPSVMVIAHLDSIAEDFEEQAPGADDNGSGVAVLLETARFLKGRSLQRTIIFCVFSNEERGTVGSKAFARKMRLERKKVHAVLNLDILGYNAPESLLTREAVMARTSLSKRMMVLWRMIREYVAGVREGKDRLVVAGRGSNAGLVRRVAGLLQVGSELRIDEIVKNDCG